MAPRAPKSLLTLVLVACALPALFPWIGLDLGAKLGEGSTVDPRSIHILLEWSAFAVALAVLTMCLAHYQSKRNPLLLIIAAATLCGSAIDATHTLASVGIISITAPEQLISPIAWTIGRSLFSAILLAGTALLLRKPSRPAREPNRFYVPISLIAGISSIAAVVWLGNLSDLPTTVFPERVIKHPYDVLPLVLFAYTGLRTIPRLRKVRHGIFIRSLHLSVLPSVAGQLHMVFGSQQLFDHDFIAAHLLKVLAYLLPAAALVHDYRLARKDASASELIFRSIFESSPDPIIVVHPETDSIVDANGRAVELLGYTHDELLATKISDIHPDEMEKLMAFAEAAMTRGSATTDSLTCLRKDGRKVPAEISGAFLVNEHGDQLMITQVRDITPRLAEAERRRKLEQQLSQAHKMEAVGRLAGGIAHDFNNMLTVINGYAEIALGQAKDPKLRDCARAVLDAGGRAANLTRGLLAFSRGQIQQKEALDLNSVADSLRSLLQRIISEDIEVICKLSDDAPSVLMDRAHLDQVIMNLMINARDAMPNGGRLTIETRLAKPAEADQHLLDPDRYAVVSVADTGVGIEPEIQAQIFDPFFTTKEIGEGTGLGLSTAYGIVRQNKGTISVQSAVGEGTIFTVFLPLVDSTAEAITPVDEVAAHPGQARVLVVEDDDLVRNLVCQTLKEKGYSVISAEDGTTGLSLCEQPGRAIDLLVTDVIMPHMSGIDLAERARQSLPHLHVLFISGYTDRGDHANPTLHGMLLRKPFSLNDLLRAVTEALSAAQPSV